MLQCMAGFTHLGMPLHPPMRAAPFSRHRLQAEQGNAITAFVVALVICAAVVAVILSSGGKQRKQVRPTEAPEPLPHSASATPSPTPIPDTEPAPATPSNSVTASDSPSEPSPVEEPAPDIATIAQTPALWPKTVNLIQPMTVPIVTNGKVVGRAQVPANTTVRLVRVSNPQLEIEYLNQRLTTPYQTTDLVAQATALARILPSKLAAAPQSQQTPVVAHAAPFRSPSTLPSQSTVQSAPLKTSNKYRNMALEVMEDIQKKFWLRESERYAKKAGSREPDMVWGAGVMFSAVVGAARHEPGKYQPVLRKFFDGLNGYWDTKVKIPGYEPAPTSGNGNDKYYDDNAWMVLTFFEAYELTRNPRFRRRAEETLEFVLSGWDETMLDGGIWWHEAREKKTRGKNTCANAPAAVGCLMSAKYSQPQAAKQRIEMTQKIVQWTVKNLQLSDALFADSISLDGGKNEGKLTYNSALMLRAFLGLYRATNNPEYLKEAQRIGRAADWFLSRDTGAYRDPVKWAHLMVEADLELYRTTKEEYLLTRARKNADFYYQTWKQNPPDDLISIASIARTLWLMADAESEVGQKFWKAVDAGKTR